MSYKGHGLTTDMAAYRRAYQQQRRDKRQAGTVSGKCECGGGVKGDGTPVYWRGSEGICEFCRESEKWESRTELKMNQMRDSKVKWDDVGSAVKRMLEVPEWMRNWANQEAPEGNIGTLLNRIECWIDDLPGELVVHGHGEYHLAL